jgi:hypothetical protein
MRKSHTLGPAGKSKAGSHGGGGGVRAAPPAARRARPRQFGIRRRSGAVHSKPRRRGRRVGADLGLCVHAADREDRPPGGGVHAHAASHPCKVRIHGRALVRLLLGADDGQGVRSQQRPAQQSQLCRLVRDAALPVGLGHVRARPAGDARRRVARRARGMGHQPERPVHAQARRRLCGGRARPAHHVVRHVRPPGACARQAAVQARPGADHERPRQRAPLHQ